MINGKVFEFNNVTSDLTNRLYDYLRDIGTLCCSRLQLMKWIMRYVEENDASDKLKYLNECTTDDAFLEFAEWLSKQSR